MTVRSSERRDSSKKKQFAENQIPPRDRVRPLFQKPVSRILSAINQSPGPNRAMRSWDSRHGTLTICTFIVPYYEALIRKH